MAQKAKNLPVKQETQVRSLGWEDPLQKGMATHSSTLAWRIPWTEEPGRLQSTTVHGVAKSETRLSHQRCPQGQLRPSGTYKCHSPSRDPKSPQLPLQQRGCPRASPPDMFTLQQSLATSIQAPCRLLQRSADFPLHIFQGVKGPK